MRSRNHWERKFQKWWHISSPKFNRKQANLKKNMNSKWMTLNNVYLTIIRIKLSQELKHWLNKIRRRKRLRKKKWEKLKPKSQQPNGPLKAWLELQEHSLLHLNNSQYRSSKSQTPSLIPNFKKCSKQKRNGPEKSLITRKRKSQKPIHQPKNGEENNN